MSNNTFSHSPQFVKKIDTSFRKIRTSIPVPESIPFLKRMYELESRSMHGQMPIIWDRAKVFKFMTHGAINGLISVVPSSWLTQVMEMKELSIPCVKY